MFTRLSESLDGERAVFGWGRNNDGQLGLGHKDSPVTTPTPIKALAGVRGLQWARGSTGEYHSAAWVSDPAVGREGEGADADEAARRATEAAAEEEQKRRAKQQQEEEAAARRAAEKKAREDADRKAREAAEKKAKEDADRKAREAAEKKAKEDADRKACEAAEKKAVVPGPGVCACVLYVLSLSHCHSHAVSFVASQIPPRGRLPRCKRGSPRFERAAMLV